MGYKEMIGETAYKGTVGIGKVKSYWDFFVGFFIFFVVTYFGYWWYGFEDVYGRNFIKGNVLKDSSCNKIKKTSNKNQNNNWDCSLNIQYNIDNKEYLKYNYLLYDSIFNYSPGSTIELRYNTLDKNDITTNTWPHKTIGTIIMLIGIFILMFVSIQLYMVRNYEIAASAVGTGYLAGTVSSSISSGWNSGR